MTEKVILVGPVERLPTMAEIAQTAMAKYPGGEGCHGFLGIHRNGFSYSVKWNKKSITVYYAD